MAEILAKMLYLWIEHGDTGAVVLAVVGGLLLLALRKGGKGNA